MIAAGDFVVSPNRARFRRVVHLVVAVGPAGTLYRYRLRCGYAMAEPRPAEEAPDAPLCRMCERYSLPVRDPRPR